MPPKMKITKENILDTAVELVRKGGDKALNARTLATILGCSTQPIFSNYATMEQLDHAVALKAQELFEDYMVRELASGKYPAYKANGMAYIRFAKEERELFKLLFMCDRDGAAIPDNAELKSRMEALVQSNTGLDSQDATLFHMEMWVYVHGIATMFATCYLDLDWELVSRMLSDAYQGLRKQYEMEG